MTDSSSEKMTPRQVFVREATVRARTLGWELVTQSQVRAWLELIEPNSFALEGVEAWVDDVLAHWREAVVDYERSLGLALPAARKVEAARERRAVKATKPRPRKRNRKADSDGTSPSE